MSHCSKLKRYIRQLAKAPRYVPVVLIPGDSPPKYMGSGWHYETHGGTWIRHPSAYRKAGWSNMTYVNSSLRVEVGENYFCDKKFSSIAVEKTVDYLEHHLMLFGFSVVKDRDLGYGIRNRETNVFMYRNLTLKQFRAISAKLIKLKAFL